MAKKRRKKPQPKRNRKKLTEQDVEDMRKLKAEGISVNEIAKMFGTNWSSVKYRLDPEFAKKKNALNKTWRNSHKKHLAKTKAKHYKENRAYYKSYNAKYHEENFEKIKQQLRVYRAKPEIKSRENKRKSLAIIKKNVELMQKIALVHDKKNVECFGWPRRGSCNTQKIPERRIDLLVFDHRHGGGSKDRAGKGKLQWLRDQLKLSNTDLKKKLQILCPTCNHHKELQERKK